MSDSAYYGKNGAEHVRAARELAEASAASRRALAEASPDTIAAARKYGEGLTGGTDLQFERGLEWFKTFAADVRDQKSTMFELVSENVLDDMSYIVEKAKAAQGPK